MRLWLAPILCAVVCGTAHAEPAEVRVWHYYRGNEARAMDVLAERFNAAQEQYRVTLLSVPYDAFANKLTNAMATIEALKKLKHETPRTS